MSPEDVLNFGLKTCSTALRYRPFFICSFVRKLCYLTSVNNTRVRRHTLTPHMFTQFPLIHAIILLHSMTKSIPTT